MRNPPSQSFVLTGDVARICDVSAQTVRSWEASGRLRAIRTARGVRLFDRSDVDELKQQRAARRPHAGPAA